MKTADLFEPAPQVAALLIRPAADGRSEVLLEETSGAHKKIAEFCTYRAAEAFCKKQAIALASAAVP